VSYSLSERTALFLWYSKGESEWSFAKIILITTFLWWATYVSLTHSPHYAGIATVLSIFTEIYTEGAYTQFQGEAVGGLCQILTWFKTAKQ
jgi:hypothetical protein